MLRNFFSDSKMIYDSLIDDESKMIFENRIMYSMTKDPAYIINIVKMLNEGRALCEILDNFDGCYVWGAGAWGRELVKIYQDKIKGIIDNNEKKWETNIYGTVVMSPKKALGDINDEKILISSRLYYKEIYNEIIDYGVSSEQIINVGKVLDKMAERQYFDIPDLQYNENDVFLDVGSLDGMTASRYVEKSTNKFSKIYCFEPDYKNIPAVRKKSYQLR